jgi:hypothetical protein
MRPFALGAAALLLAASPFRLPGCGSWHPLADLLGGVSLAAAEARPEGLLEATASVALGPSRWVSLTGIGPTPL